MKSTPIILQSVAQLGLIKEYSFFIKIKSLHSNSVIYKPKQLHLKLNCSRTKVRRILAIIIEQEWGYYSKGHLVLNSAKTIHNNCHHKKAVTYIEIKNIEDIHVELLKNKLRQSEFVKQQKSNLTQKASTKALKFFKGEKGFVKDSQLEMKHGTGLQVLSPIFGYSEGHTGVILRYLDSCGLINIKRRKPELISFEPNFNSKYLPKGYFMKGCFIYKRLTNQIYIDA